MHPDSFSDIKCGPGIESVNPIVIAGIMAMAVLSSAMMISFSDGQVRHSHTAEQVSNLQAERVQERMSVTSRDGQVIFENTGSVTVHVKEIRMLDGDGQIISRQKADVAVPAAHTGAVRLSGQTQEEEGEG